MAGNQIQIPTATMTVVFDGPRVIAVNVSYQSKVTFAWMARERKAKKVIVPSSEQVLRLEMGPNHLGAIVMATALRNAGLTAELHAAAGRPVAMEKQDAIGAGESEVQ